jgi:hypothetical protein
MKSPNKFLSSVNSQESYDLDNESVFSETMSTLSYNGLPSAKKTYSMLMYGSPLNARKTPPSYNFTAISLNADTSSSEIVPSSSDKTYPKPTHIESKLIVLPSHSNSPGQVLYGETILSPKDPVNAPSRSFISSPNKVLPPRLSSSLLNSHMKYPPSSSSFTSPTLSADASSVSQSLFRRDIKTTVNSSSSQPSTSIQYPLPYTPPSNPLPSTVCSTYLPSQPVVLLPNTFLPPTQPPVLESSTSVAVNDIQTDDVNPFFFFIMIFFLYICIFIFIIFFFYYSLFLSVITS